jgi:hypothetical protein
MLRVVTVVQQVMTKFNDAVSEEDKIVGITKIVLNLMKQSQSHIATDGQSVCLSWCRAPSGAYEQKCIIF